MSAQELAERLPHNDMVVLDVRGATEYAQAHIKGASNIAVGLLPRHLEELPKDAPIVTYCRSGYRAQIAASLLRCIQVACRMQRTVKKLGGWSVGCFIRALHSCALAPKAKGILLPVFIDAQGDDSVNQWLNRSSPLSLM